MFLPIDSHIPEIIQKLHETSNLILKAPPGTGKTTRIPPAIYRNKKWNPESEIWILVPRRLAAKMAARFVAKEFGEDVGETVGYQFRFEKVVSGKTRIKFLTEGMMIRLLMNDPTLKNVGCVILDEFHERHLHTDLSLSYLKHLQNTNRPDLKLIVMSATIDTDALEAYLKPATVHRVETKSHPVDIHYLASSSELQIEKAIAQTLKQHLKKNIPGDVLIFLSGMAEILKTQKEIEKIEGIKTLVLHGDLSRQEQDQAFEASSRIKVILSTNIAESSVTIPGITTVIDAGTHKQAQFSWWSGIPSLKTKPISQASAIQRAGRAGRQSPGRCYRMYAEHDFKTRPPFESPEIKRADLTQSLLELFALNINPRALNWYEPPEPAAIEMSLRLLEEWGAIENNMITELGRQMANIPLQPRLAKLMIEAKKMGVSGEAALIASRISEDNLTQLCLWDELKQSPDSQLRQLITTLNKAVESINIGVHVANPQRALVAVFTQAYQDCVAKKIKTTDNYVELLFCNGSTGRVSLSPDVAHHELFVIIDAFQGKFGAQVRSLFSIEEEDLLELKLLRDENEIAWDDKKQKVSLHSCVTYGKITLEESRKYQLEGVSTGDVFFKSFLKILPDDFRKKSLIDCVSFLSNKGVDGEQLESILSRCELVLQEAGSLVTALYQALSHMKSAEEFKGINWAQKISEAALGNEAHRLNQLCPEFITLKNNRKAKVQYQLGKPPVVSGPLQVFAGMRDLPKICEGRVKPIIHLLAPNKRPIQVTSDLESFWTKMYPEIKPQLSRRYPKHQWP